MLDININSIKRFIAFLVGAAAITLNKKLGLELTTENQAALVTLIVAFIGQSMLKEKSLAQLKIESESAVTDTKSAIDVLNSTKAIVMVVLAALMLMPFTALAQETDRPQAVELRQGEVAPETGCFLPTKTCLATARQLDVQRRTIEQLSTRPQWWVVGVSMAVGVIVGAGAAVYLVHR